MGNLTPKAILSTTVDLISSNLIQLVNLNNELDKYKFTSTNIIDLNEDTDILEKLEITVDLRLKIVDFIDGARKYVVDAVESGDVELEEELRKLKTLAEYYIYAGVKIDRRIASKYMRKFNIENFEESIEDLYNSFAGLLRIMGINLLPER